MKRSNQMEETSPLLNNAEPVLLPPILETYSEPESDVPPTPYDEGWSEYVLSELSDDEKYGNNPTTDGLRRIVNVLLGAIIKSVPVYIQPPTPQNDNHATVSWEISILFDDGTTRVFGDVADVYAGNTDAEY